MANDRYIVDANRIRKINKNTLKPITSDTEPPLQPQSRVKFKDPPLGTGDGVPARIVGSGDNVSPANPDNSGLGAAGGAIAATWLDNLIRGGKTAQVLATGGKLDKLSDALLSETNIGTGAAIGDALETSGKALFSGNIPTAKKALESAGKEFLFSTGIGLPVRGAVGAFNKLTFSPARVRNSNVELAYDVFEEGMAKRGFPPVRLATATDSTLVDALDNYMGTAIGGASRMSKMSTAYKEVSDEILNNLSARMGPQEGLDNLGKTLLEVIEHKDEITKIPAVIRRNSVIAQAEDAGLRLNSNTTTAFIQKNKDVIDSLAGFGSGVSGVSASESLLNLADSLSPAQFMHMRDLVRQTKRSIEADPVEAVTGKVGLFKELDSIITKELHRSFGEFDKATGSNLKRVVEESDELFKNYYNTFYNPIVTKLKKSISLQSGGNPAGIATLLVRPETKGSLAYVKALKEAMPTEAWTKVQRATLDKIRELTLKDGKYNGKLMDEMFSSQKEFSKNRIGEESLIEIFGEDTFSALKDFAGAMRFVQEKNPISYGKVLASLTQGGALAGVAYNLSQGDVMDAATLTGMIVGVPWMFTRLMTSPTVVKALTKGLRQSPKHPGWPALYSKIIAHIGVVNMQEQRGAQRQVPQQTSQRNDPLLSELLRGPAVAQ